MFAISFSVNRLFYNFILFLSREGDLKIIVIINNQ